MTELAHERLDVYRLYLEVAGLCGDIVSRPAGPYAVLDQLDRAMESVGVNLMRANTQAPGSPQRMSYLDVSIASVHECAASLDVCFAKHAVESAEHGAVVDMLWRIRGMLLGLKRASANRAREDSTSYGTPRFPFAGLDMYRLFLEGVSWTQDLLEEGTPKARTRRKLDVSATGTVLNIAEGHGRASATDQNRFMKMAQEHAYQTLLMLDLMVSRGEFSKARILDGKSTQARVISMLHAWCASNLKRGEGKI